jgi:hypothetical protein
MLRDMWMTSTAIICTSLEINPSTQSGTSDQRSIQEGLLPNPPQKTCPLPKKPLAKDGGPTKGAYESNQNIFWYQGLEDTKLVSSIKINSQCGSSNIEHINVFHPKTSGHFSA